MLDLWKAEIKVTWRSLIVKITRHQYRLKAIKILNIYLTLNLAQKPSPWLLILNAKKYSNVKKSVIRLLFVVGNPFVRFTARISLSSFFAFNSRQVTSDSDCLVRITISKKKFWKKRNSLNLDVVWLSLFVGSDEQQLFSQSQDL